MSRDPLGYSRKRLTLLEFVYGNPLALLDPLGLAPSGSVLRTHQLHQEWIARVTSTYTRPELQSEFPPAAGTWFPEPGVRISRTCALTGRVFMRVGARESLGSVVDTSLGVWEYNRLTFLGWLWYALGNAGGGPFAVFRRTVTSVHDVIEEWDVFWEEECQTVRSELGTCGWRIFQPNTMLFYRYAATGRLRTDRVTAVVGWEEATGLTWIDSTTGLVHARDPDFVYYGIVAYFAIAPV